MKPINGQTTQFSLTHNYQPKKSIRELLMTEFAKMDIFFFITTIALVLLVILLIIMALYLISIFNDIKYITKKAKAQSDLIAEDLDELRHKVKNGFSWSSLIYFFTKLFKKRKS
jgi:hypothetical protein